MADDFEEKPRISHDVASAKASIFEVLNNLKKWRAEQFEECQKKQYIESQKLLELSRKNQKQFEELLDKTAKCPSSSPQKKPDEVPKTSDNRFDGTSTDLDDSCTLQESPISGHLQRCFHDSSGSNISVSENQISSIAERIPVFSELRKLQFFENNPDDKGVQLEVKNGPSNCAAKPKRPFLKKGSGLLRYMPKSDSAQGRTHNECRKGSSKENNFPVKKALLPQKVLKLKPAIRKNDPPSQHVKHIRFDITDCDDDADVEFLTENDTPSLPKISEDSETVIEKSVPMSSSSLRSSSPDPLKVDDVSNSGSESLNLSKEFKELEEFEMLENCAQNSSFNSDSSLVQRVLQGESVKSSGDNPVIQNYLTKVLPESNIASGEEDIPRSLKGTSYFPEAPSHTKYLEEIQAKKQFIEKVISDINPRIQTLQKEISCSQKGIFDESDVNDQSSTFLEDVNSHGRQPSQVLLPECNANIHSLNLDNSPITHADDSVEVTNEEVHYRQSNINDVLENSYQDDDSNICNDEEASFCNKGYDSKGGCCGKSEIQSKLLELEEEIETYQKLNSRIKVQCKERDEIVRKLQKERDDFNKYKEAEKKKLEEEIQEERRQIKRQKETFMRLQKLRKDNPTKKERDELNALRLEIEKLQDELKRQKIKYTNDSRRWKNRLDAAEKERDSFKFENVRLEEQCQDLLAALKTRMKKKPETKSWDDEKDDNIKIIENPKPTAECKDAASQTDPEKSNLVMPKPTDVKKAKVHFSFPNHEEKDIEIIDEDTDIPVNDVGKNYNFFSEDDDSVIPNNELNNCKENGDEAVENGNLSTISVSAEAEYKEIHHPNAVERIYLSGEREILYNSGTRKVISADGKSRRFLFHNGDVKEIFPDSKQIYRYVNGVIETQFPDGLKVTEYPTGDILRRYPDGQKEMRFADGTVHNTYADGSEAIHSYDGNVVNLEANGTKVIKFANGQTEIRTNSYKRREFPDGSIKILYNSGRQETRYSSGRVRIKDKQGNVLFDTKYLGTPKG